MSAVNKPDSAGSAIAARIKSLAPGIGLSAVITLVSLAFSSSKSACSAIPIWKRW